VGSVQKGLGVYRWGVGEKKIRRSKQKIEGKIREVNKLIITLRERTEQKKGTSRMGAFKPRP